MKEIQTNGITILLVEVPEDAILFEVEEYSLLSFVYPHTDMPDFVAIPSSQYQILGKSTESIHELLGISKESYLSLLEANGVVDRNLYEKPDEDKILDEYSCNENVIAKMVYREDLEQWQEAQSKVKHYLVLKRI